MGADNRVHLEERISVPFERPQKAFQKKIHCICGSFLPVSKEGVSQGLLRIATRPYSCQCVGILARTIESHIYRGCPSKRPFKGNPFGFPYLPLFGITSPFGIPTLPPWNPLTSFLNSLETACKRPFLVVPILSVMPMCCLVHGGLTSSPILFDNAFLRGSYPFLMGHCRENVRNLSQGCF